MDDEQYKIDFSRFAAICGEIAAPGYGEFYLWDSLQGKRPMLGPFHNAPCAEDMEMLARFRDVYRAWPYYDLALEEWGITPIDAWSDHVLQYGVRAIGAYYEQVDRALTSSKEVM